VAVAEEKLPMPAIRDASGRFLRREDAGRRGGAPRTLGLIQGGRQRRRGSAAMATVSDTRGRNREEGEDSERGRSRGR
jgi:hypothetical protein